MLYTLNSRLLIDRTKSSTSIENSIVCVCVCVLTQPFHALMLLACLLALYCCECSASSSWQIAVGASGAAIVLAVVAILIVMKRRGTGVTPSSSSSAKVRGQHTTRGSIPSCEYSFSFLSWLFSTLTSRGHCMLSRCFLLLMHAAGRRSSNRCFHQPCLCRLVHTPRYAF